MGTVYENSVENAAPPLEDHGKATVMHDFDVDEALKALELNGHENIKLDNAAHKRLLRRIDLIMMPILCISYGLSYLDKTALSYSSVMGLESDLGLIGDDYQWLGSIFYFGTNAMTALGTRRDLAYQYLLGYLAWELPTGRLLQLLPLAKYNGTSLILWGLTLACFAAARSFPGAVAVRFFLGVLEASVTPGFALMTSQWYTQKEQAARVSLWVSFNGFAQIFGGLISYGIASRNGYSLASWKIVFLLYGLITIVVGVVFLLVIPDSQLNARWLSPEDRLLAIERVRTNQQGIGNKSFKFYQFKEALTDLQTWAIFVLAVALDIGNGGLSNFFNQLIVSFGFTAKQSLLYGAPAGAVEAIAVIAWGWISQRRGNRILWSIAGILIGLLGAVLIVALPLDLKVGRLIGYYLTLAYSTGFAVGVSLVASNTAGYTKKTTVGATFLIGYCAGNIIGPQTYRPQDAPRYASAEITVVVIMIVSIIDLLFIYLWSRHRNNKKAAFIAQPEYQKRENQEFLDMTDGENMDFIYAL